MGATVRAEPDFDGLVLKATTVLIPESAGAGGEQVSGCESKAQRETCQAPASCHRCHPLSAAPGSGGALPRAAVVNPGRSSPATQEM